MPDDRRRGRRITARERRELARRRHEFELREYERARRRGQLYDDYYASPEGLGMGYFVMFFILVLLFAGILAGVYYSLDPLDTAAAVMFAGSVLIAATLLFGFYFGARRVYSNSYGRYDFDQPWGKAMLGMVALGAIGIVMVIIGAINTK